MNEPMRLLALIEVIGLTGIARYYVGKSEETQYLECVKSLLEAQLAHAQQHEQERVESIFKEIESKEEQDMQSDTFTVSESMEWWQSLKKQEGVT